MPLEGALVRFLAKEDQKPYFAILPIEKTSVPEPPAAGITLQGYSSLDNLEAKSFTKSVTVERVRVINL